VATTSIVNIGTALLGTEAVWEGNSQARQRGLQVIVTQKVVLSQSMKWKILWLLVGGQGKKRQETKKPAGFAGFTGWVGDRRFELLTSTV
jgi:hypothetical protein